MLVEDAIKNYGKVLCRVFQTKCNGDSAEVSSKFSAIGWIDSNDALPEGMNMLDGARLILGVIDNEVRLVNFDEDDRVWTSFLTGLVLRGDVTHWMPLPQPPEIVE
jgi:hypothetical protein